MQRWDWAEKQMKTLTDFVELETEEEELVDVTELDRQRFALVRVLGAGVYGVVVLVTDLRPETGGREFAVKISTPTEGRRGLAAAQRLARAGAGVFVRTLGYFYSDSIPVEWEDAFDAAIARKTLEWPTTLDEEDVLLYTFMDYKPHRFGELAPTLTKRDVKHQLLILLHGLLVARQTLQFSHGDIHRDNIVFEPNRSLPDRAVPLGDRFELRGVRYVPFLIDFDEANMGDDAPQEEQEEEEDDELFTLEGPRRATGVPDDLAQLEYVYGELVSLDELVRSDDWRMARDQETRSQWRYLERVVFEHPFFDDVRLPAYLGSALSCFLCGGRSTASTFCSHACASAVSSFYTY